MKRIILSLLMVVVALGAMAQSADKLYEEGKKLYDEKKYEQAFPLLKKAAEKGHKKAQYRLGRCYDKGHGVEEDNKTAFIWYEKAAKQDHAKSQFQLARYYLKGKGGISVDKEKAAKLLKKAVKGGSKSGKEIEEELKADAAKGDEEAIQLLELLKH
ncbi:MAG: sel1 repeat family protein [Prevotella sp.]|nr:sel1 repeat family protein [Prevotella sp.]MBR3480942.1 sel1 repeat family protein [Prevotella sp.]MBR6189081.1 sel1 repeat family protein [Prevotella sp.]